MYDIGPNGIVVDKDLSTLTDLQLQTKEAHLIQYEKALPYQEEKKIAADELARVSEEVVNRDLPLFNPVDALKRVKARLKLSEALPTTRSRKKAG